MTNYEIWANDDSATMAESTRIQKLRDDELIEKDAKKIHAFSAETFDEANVIYDRVLREQT